MKKKILLLITILTFIICIDKVGATCYKVTNSNGVVSYTNINPSEMASKVEKVDDSYCNSVFDGIECAENATSPYECQKCSGYMWDESKSKCLTPNIVTNQPTYCYELGDTTCNAGTKDYACVWNDTYKFCNTDKLTYVRCGDSYDIPSDVPGLISFAVNLLKIATPIILIIIGMITLVKALAASKEDEIKKAQNSLVKKLIAAALVFFVISIVQFVMSIVADDSEKGSITSCLKCFLNNDCEGSMYYKTNISGTYWCTYLDSPENKDVCPGSNLSDMKPNGSSSNNTDQDKTETENQYESSSDREFSGGGRDF